FGQARSGEQARAALLAGAFDVQVDPGNAEIERGASLLVVARFRGNVPADAELVVDGGPDDQGRHAMSRSLEDPTFAGRIESVGRSTPSYRVKVFEYPELQRADAHLTFPSYTAMDPKTVEDIRHVTAVEGTDLALDCRLNKDVSSARLVDEEGRDIPL